MQIEIKGRKIHLSTLLILIFMILVLIILIVYWFIVVIDIMEQKRIIKDIGANIKNICDFIKISLT